MMDEDSGLYLSLDDLLAEKEVLYSRDHIFDAPEWLTLVDRFLGLGEEEADDDVLLPAIELYLVARGAHENGAYLRLARCHMLMGRYTAARTALERCDATTPADDEATRAEALALRKRLFGRIARDGKVGLIGIAGIVVGGLIWWLKRRQAAKAAEAAAAGTAEHVAAE